MTLRCECKKCVRKKKGSHSVSRYKNREKTHSGDFSHCWNHTEIFPLLVWILILFLRSALPVTLPFLSPACFLLNFYVLLLNTSAPLETDLTSVFQTFISASFFDEINTDFLIGPPH